MFSQLLGMKVKQVNGVIWLKINPSTTISMKRFRGELSMAMVIDGGIPKNIHIGLFPFLNFIPKPGMGLPKPVVVSTVWH